MTARDILVAALAVGLSSASAMGQSLPSGDYFGLTGGLSTFYDVDDIDFDLFGILIAGELGYHGSPRSRLEIELLYETSGADDAEVVRGTLSYYYNFIDRTPVRRFRRSTPMPAAVVDSPRLTSTVSKTTPSTPMPRPVCWCRSTTSTQTWSARFASSTPLSTMTTASTTT